MNKENISIFWRPASGSKKKEPNKKHGDKNSSSKIKKNQWKDLIKVNVYNPFTVIL